MRASRALVGLALGALCLAASAQTAVSDVRDVDLHDLLLAVGLVVVYALGFIGGNQGGGVA
jgi:hypothetical protein